MNLGCHRETIKWGSPDLLEDVIKGTTGNSGREMSALMLEKQRLALSPGWKWSQRPEVGQSWKAGALVRRQHMVMRRNPAENPQYSCSLEGN